MPGTEMMGEYTLDQIQRMSPTELIEAQQRGFTKPLVAGPIEAQRLAAGIQIDSSVQARVEQPQDGGNVWANRKKGDKDFICPSGQKCRLRPLDLEKLMMAGVLDQVTRLEGLAQELINKAEGQPPTIAKMPSKDEFSTLLDLVNVVVPMAVAEPRIWENDDPSAPENAVRISDIDLEDRLAILNEALSGVKLMDKFRSAG